MAELTKVEIKKIKKIEDIIEIIEIIEAIRMSVLFDLLTAWLFIYHWDYL